MAIPKEGGDSVDDAFGHWLCGFIDGEGCFSIHLSNGGRCHPRFSLTIRSDDRAILDEAQRRCNVGRVYDSDKGDDKRAPTLRWEVYRKWDCVQFIELIDRYGLRSKKKADYEVWREAVLHWAKMKPIRGSHVPYAWTVMQRLRVQLRAGRVFPAGEYADAEECMTEQYRLW